MSRRIDWYAIIIVVSALLGGSAVAGAQGPFELKQTFSNPSPANSDLFGISVSLSAGRGLIGAWLDDSGGTNSGQAYLFDLASGALLNTLAKPNPTLNEQFGLSVSLYGDRALVGAQNVRGPGSFGAGAGAAYLYDANSGTLLRTFTKPYPPTPPNPLLLLDNFGHAVSLYGNRALISAIGVDTGASNAGAAYLFDTNTGLLLQTFLNPTPGASDQFGYRVALFGDKALISALLDDTGATNTGAVYLFDTTSGALLHTFLNPTPAANDNFGIDIALSADQALIGAISDSTFGFRHGAAYIFDLNTGNLLHTLTGPGTEADLFFGEGVALSGNHALVGVPFNHAGTQHVGSAYLFDANTGQLLQEIPYPGTYSEERFGKAVALDGNEALIGAQTDVDPANPVNLIRPGSAYYYAVPPNTPPVAAAGPDRTVRLGSMVTIDGSASSDPDNGPQPLTFAWTQTAGSPLTLAGSSTATPTFTPVVASGYTLSLVVNDGWDDSPPDTVDISVPILGDIDLDGDVDKNDVILLVAARNTPADGPNDLRDLNGDGRIDALDARKAVTLCTRTGCAVQ